MPFSSTHTPEALIPRTDSRNPTTTCRGITSNGRPCRRALAASTVKSPFKGVVAVTPRSNLRHEGNGIEDGREVVEATFYCWQHKDQARRAVDHSRAAGIGGKVMPLRPQDSIDTLVDRLGGIDLGANQQAAATQPMPTSFKDGKHKTTDYPPTTVKHRRSSHAPPSRPTHGSRHQPKTGFLSALCCTASAASDNDEDYIEIVRHKKRTQNNIRSHDRTDTAEMYSARAASVPPASASGHYNTPPSPCPPQASQHYPNLSYDPLKYHSSPATTAPHHQTYPSLNPTGDLLSFISPSLNPRTSSSILAEMSKPISAFDEPGYIYIFWLTDSADPQPAPSDSVTASLLSPRNTLFSPPGKTAPQQNGSKQGSDLLRRYSRVRRTAYGHSAPGLRPRHSSAQEWSQPTERRTVMLKIGRASNVHRRMSEWTRQCGHNLSLIRFYPHVPSTAIQPAQKSYTSPYDSSPKPREGQAERRGSSGNIRKVPCSHRVERLLHIELAGRGMKAEGSECAACGREHREWFEIEATLDGLRLVDDIVKRWVDWAETTQVD